MRLNRRLGFLQRLRANPEFAELPVVAISGAKDRYLVLKLIDLGIVDYILKPIELEQTFKRIEKLIPLVVTRSEAPKP